MPIVGLFFALLVSLVNAAPVRVVAFDFLQSTKGLAHHPIQRLETNEIFNTTENGYLELDIPVGQNVTFISLDYNGFHRTQTATVTVPPEGLNTLMTEMVL